MDWSSAFRTTFGEIHRCVRYDSDSGKSEGMLSSVASAMAGMALLLPVFIYKVPKLVAAAARN